MARLERHKTMHSSCFILRRTPNAHSPEGPANVVPSLAGEPKFGVPFEFQFTFCAIVYLFPSHAPVLVAVA